MRLRIRHRLQVRFPEPTRNVVGVLRLSPRSHEGQRITNWRIDVDPDCLLRRGEDHFGNVTHVLNVPGVSQEITVVAQGELTSFDAAGVVRGSAERLPTEVFRRDTALTDPNDAMRAFAEDATTGSVNAIERLHRLMAAVNRDIAVEEASQGARPAAAIDVLAAKAADGAGHAHLFIACARQLGYPARCASGYVLGSPGASQRHAWAEAFVENLGWIGFDTVRDICPQDDHVRVAVGLDAVDAAPVRTVPGEIAAETVDITWLLARDNGAQSQSAMA